jgi:hypothetical protein
METSHYFRMSSLFADEFTDANVQRWQKQFMNTVSKDRALLASSTLGSNGVA